jgi:KamA family protein
VRNPSGPAARYRAVTARDLPGLVAAGRLTPERALTVRAVSTVLPFRTNEYVVDSLIDWSAGDDDPIFRLTFPQAGLLAPPDLERLTDLLRRDASAELARAVREIRERLNPHPDGQRELNMPRPGLQHKYAETLLVFPSQGQTCHAYCTYCFRWPQFVGQPDLRMATNDVDGFVGYLRAHPEITDVLVTGGDALVMSAELLGRWVDAALTVDTVRTIRLGTKALSFWPYRFVTDPDADDLMRVFERVVASGRHLAVMAHFSHPREVAPAIVASAIRRIRATGAVIRCQAPLIRGINDDASIWADLWTVTTGLGVVPYYMFVERETGPKDWFAVPLARAHEIFRDAYARVSGLARTVRGPVMSATPGKVVVDGVATVAGQEVFVLRFLQARDPALVGRPFFAEYDPTATWFTDLKPALGAGTFLEP